MTFIKNRAVHLVAAAVVLATLTACAGGKNEVPTHSMDNNHTQSTHDKMYGTPIAAASLARGKTAVRTVNAKTASPAFVITALATAVRVNRKTK